MQFKFLLLPLFLVILLWFSGCRTVPQTGRSAFHLGPTKQLNSMASIQFERLKKGVPKSRDANHNAMLRRVGEHIADVAAPEMPNAHGEFIKLYILSYPLTS